MNKLTTIYKPQSLIARSFFNKSYNKILLGRWNRSSEQLTEIKVNWANIDHCGTCSKEDLSRKYADLLPASIVEDDLLYQFDTYPELIKITKPKKNTTGINYFLTRAFM